MYVCSPGMTHFAKSINTSSMKYVVSGATGHTGSIVAHQLLDAGLEVRVLGRSEDKLKPFADKGAEIHTVDLTDAAQTAQALEGAGAVYVVIPPNFVAPDFRAYQDQVTDHFARALEQHAIPYAVPLSSCGAHMGQGAGVVDGLAELERRLNAIEGLNVLHLRPTFFMENLMGMLPMAAQMQGIGYALPGDRKMPMISTDDIGAVAAERLRKLDFSGKHVHHLLGERDLTMEEAVEALNQALDGVTRLRYMPVEYEQAEQGMLQMGASQSIVKLYTEFMQGMNAGRINEVAERSPETTTPTSIEDFARRKFAPALKGMLAQQA